MYALVIILMMVTQPGENPNIQYKVVLTASSTVCELLRTKTITSIPKELKITNVRHACIPLGEEQKES